MKKYLVKKEGKNLYSLYEWNGREYIWVGIYTKKEILNMQYIFEEIS